MNLIIHLPRSIIETIESTRESTMEIDDEEYYIWCGELYAEKNVSGYCKQIEVIEISKQ